MTGSRIARSDWLAVAWRARRSLKIPPSQLSLRTAADSGQSSWPSIVNGTMNFNQRFTFLIIRPFLPSMTLDQPTNALIELLALRSRERLPFGICEWCRLSLPLDFFRRLGCRKSEASEFVKIQRSPDELRARMQSSYF
jgi:hypothetical protein